MRGSSAGAEYRTYIPVPDQKGQRTFTDKGGMLARESFHDNRKRVRRKKGKALLRLRGERIERSFALACETGAHRRLRLRGRDNARKRYIAHIAALNLGLVMRTLFGYGTPRELAAAIAAAWVALLLRLMGRARYAGNRLVGMNLPPAVGDLIATQTPA